MRIIRRSDHAPDCSLCRSATDDDGLTCPGCGASYHAACLREMHGGCATLGCTARLHAPAGGASPTPDRRGFSPSSLLVSGALLLASAVYVLVVLGPLIDRVLDVEASGAGLIAALLLGGLGLVVLFSGLASVLSPGSPLPGDEDRR